LKAKIKAYGKNQFRTQRRDFRRMEYQLSPTV